MVLKAQSFLRIICPSPHRWWILANLSSNLEGKKKYYNFISPLHDLSMQTVDTKSMDVTKFSKLPGGNEIIKFTLNLTV